MTGLFRLQMQTARMLGEAQMVIGLRLLGMAGVLPAAKGENERMVAEKQAAFTKAGWAAATAMMTGQGAAQAYGRALAPIGRTTRANTRRLTKGAWR